MSAIDIIELITLNVILTDAIRELDEVALQLS